MDLILFGIQGSGKGTQGKILAERYGIKVFETGAALRALAQEGKHTVAMAREGNIAGSPLGSDARSEAKNLAQPVLSQSEPTKRTQLAKKIKSIIDTGHLVPNEVVMEIVEDFMNKQEGNSPILFDGIPRSTEQAKSLNALLDKHGRTYTAVEIDLSQDSALTRLTTRRICKKDKSVYPSNYKNDTCEKCGGELITRADDNPESIKIRLQAFTDETLPAIELYQENLIKVDGEPSIEEVSQSLYSALDPIMKA